MSTNAKINRLKKKLEELKRKPPRMGVYPTKVIPDKTKYRRKPKHKKEIEHG